MIGREQELWIEGFEDAEEDDEEVVGEVRNIGFSFDFETGGRAWERSFSQGRIVF